MEINAPKNTKQLTAPLDDRNAEVFTEFHHNQKITERLFELIRLLRNHVGWLLNSIEFMTSTTSFSKRCDPISVCIPFIIRRDEGSGHLYHSVTC